MIFLARLLNRIVTAFLVSAAFFVVTSTIALAQDADVDLLFFDLADPKNENWEETEARIRAAFSDSGSESMNLLLERGYMALAAGEADVAIEHFTALTDHAPDFAEGFNGRAKAYELAGYFGPAVDDIARALALEPRHFSAMIGLARILDDVGKSKQALELYRQVAILHPNQPEVAQEIVRLEDLVSGTNL